MKTKVIPHFLDCKEWNNIKLKKMILKENWRSKMKMKKMSFCSIYRMNMIFGIIKLQSLTVPNMQKFLQNQLLATEVWAVKVDQKHRKKAIFGRFWTTLPVYISVTITDFAKIFAHLERSKIEVLLHQKSCSSCK